MHLRYYGLVMATLQYPNFPRANVLVLGSNAVQALLPSTLISQADALLLAHRLEDVADLAEQQRKKLQSLLTADRHEVSASAPPTAPSSSRHSSTSCAT